MLQEAGYIKNSCFGFSTHSMFTFDVIWGARSLANQARPQKVLDPDYLPGYFSVSYDYAQNNKNYKNHKVQTECVILLKTFV